MAKTETIAYLLGAIYYMVKLLLIPILYGGLYDDFIPVDDLLLDLENGNLLLLSRSCAPGKFSRGGLKKNHHTNHIICNGISKSFTI